MSLNYESGKVFFECSMIMENGTKINFVSNDFRDAVNQHKFKQWLKIEDIEL